MLIVSCLQSCSRHAIRACLSLLCKTVRTFSESRHLRMISRAQLHEPFAGVSFRIRTDYHQ